MYTCKNLNSQHDCNTTWIRAQSCIRGWCTYIYTGKRYNYSEGLSMFSSMATMSHSRSVVIIITSVETGRIGVEVTTVVFQVATSVCE